MDDHIRSSARPPPKEPPLYVSTTLHIEYDATLVPFLHVWWGGGDKKRETTTDQLRMVPNGWSYSSLVAEPLMARRGESFPFDAVCVTSRGQAAPGSVCSFVGI